MKSILIELDTNTSMQAIRSTTNSMCDIQLKANNTTVTIRGTQAQAELIAQAIEQSR